MGYDDPCRYDNKLVQEVEMVSLKSLCVSVLAVVLVSGCALSGGARQSCKVLDPDLAQGLYRGGCRDGLADGYGRVTGASSYRGDFRAGKKHGKGVKVMLNGDRYSGEFSDDYRHGNGVYVWGDGTPWAGDSYAGEYQRDRRYGWGVFQWGSGDRYEGPWQDDLRLGPSVMELRRAQALASLLKVGAGVCADEKWDGVIDQRIKGTVESVMGNIVQVRIVEVEGGFVDYRGARLTVGDLIAGEPAHWQACGQD